MKIYAPVKSTTGIYASVLFVNGVGETDDPALIQWFIEHGYEVEGEGQSPTPFPNPKAVEEQRPTEQPDLDAMTPYELREWALENGFGNKIRNTRNKQKLLDIIRG